MEAGYFFNKLPHNAREVFQICYAMCVIDKRALNKSVVLGGLNWTGKFQCNWVKYEAGQWRLCLRRLGMSVRLLPSDSTEITIDTTVERSGSGQAEANLERQVSERSTEVLLQACSVVLSTIFLLLTCWSSER